MKDLLRLARLNLLGVSRSTRSTSMSTTVWNRSHLKNIYCIDNVLSISAQWGLWALLPNGPRCAVRPTGGRSADSGPMASISCCGLTPPRRLEIASDPTLPPHPAHPCHRDTAQFYGRGPRPLGSRCPGPARLNCVDRDGRGGGGVKKIFKATWRCETETRNACHDTTSIPMHVLCTF